MEVKGTVKLYTSQGQSLGNESKFGITYVASFDRNGSNDSTVRERNGFVKGKNIICPRDTVQV